MDNPFLVAQFVVTPQNFHDVLSIIDAEGDIYGTEGAYRESISGASPGQIAIFAVTWYMSEVNNGGHYQFFSNSTGIVWEDALAGLELIGDEERASILKESIDHIPGKPCTLRSRQAHRPSR